MKKLFFHFFSWCVKGVKLRKIKNKTLTVAVTVCWTNKLTLPQMELKLSSNLKIVVRQQVSVVYLLRPVSSYCCTLYIQLKQTAFTKSTSFPDSVGLTACSQKNKTNNDCNVNAGNVTVTISKGKMINSI